MHPSSDLLTIKTVTAIYAETLENGATKPQKLK
jgi:hypothetical protein